MAEKTENKVDEGKKQVVTPLTIEERSFENRGETVNYVVCEAEVFGQKIRFEPTEKDARLCRYLLDLNKITTPRAEKEDN